MNYGKMLPALALCLCLTTDSTLAANVYFDNNAGDLKYETAGNWYDGSTRYLPSAGHDGIIAGYNATLSSNVSNYVPDNFYLGYINSAFPTVSGDGTLTLNNSTASLSVGSLRLGFSDSTTTQSNGTINLQAGSITTGSATYIGYGNGSTTGTAGGNGTVTQTGGASFTGTSGNLYLGYGYNSSGNYSISGSDGLGTYSSASFASSVYLGYYGGSSGELTIGTAAGSDECSFAAGTSSYIHVGYGSGGNATGTITVQGNSTLTGGALSIGGGSSSYTGSEGTVYVKDNATVNMAYTSGSSRVGFYGQGTLEQTGGDVSLAGNLYISYGAASKGTYDISHGTLTTTNASRTAYIGYSNGSDALLKISGDAEVELNTKVYLGNYGAGKIEQTGGTTTVNNLLYLGYNTTGNGTLDISGGTFTTGSNAVYLGYRNVGNIKLDGANTSLSTGTLYLGGHPDYSSYTTGNGTFTQDDGSFTASALQVGVYGTGTYYMNAGTAEIGNSTIIGYKAGSTGTFEQTDGDVTVAGSVIIGHYGTGTLTISGGSFDNHVNDTDTYNTQVGNGASSVGVLNIQSTGVYSTRELDVGWTPGCSATLNQFGGTLNASSAVLIGVYGVASYNMSGGTATSAGNFILGYADGASGTLTISNDAEYNSGGSFTVGGSGDGVANINGGTINASSGAVSVSHSSTSSGVVTQTAGSVNAVWMLLGDGAGSDGEYNMSGGDVNLTWQLLVGHQGVGRMNLSGGTINSDENVQIGNESAGQGTLTQTGGAINADMLCVGNEGTGTFNYTGGATVITGNTFIGRGDSGTGIIDFGTAGNTLTTRSLFAASSQVAGTGSINTNGLVSDENLVFDSTASLTQTLNWGSVAVNLDLTKGVDNGSLGAGWIGTGSVTITNGVTVNSQRGYLGYRTGSTGMATVSGGATWNVGDLTIGRNGTGTLNIDDGTVNLLGGDVDTGDSGSGTFNFKAGTLKNVGEVSTGVNLQTGGSGAVFRQETGYAGLVSGDISGGGSLTKTGGDVLGLTGANTYTGLTTVQEGTLQMTGSAAWSPVLNIGGADVQADGVLIFDYTDESTVISSVRDGLASGMIYSSDASASCGLGYSDDSASLVTVEYALYGDANLDGEVNGVDLSLLAANWTDTDCFWIEGDFNYDGEINGIDLSLMASNWSASLNSMTFAEALTSVNLTAVPEPSTVTLLIVGLLGMIAYAWRKRR